VVHRAQPAPLRKVVEVDQLQTALISYIGREGTCRTAKLEHNASLGGHAMGLGMQMVYLGFAGSAAIEAEAGVQLLRLERFGKLLKSCHLAIEEVHGSDASQTYDVRLDLVTLSSGFNPVAHHCGPDPLVVMREAFDAAEHELETKSA
jgi:hypothetical protein